MANRRGHHVRLTGEGFWGSQQKASLVGLSPVTQTTETSKEGPFQGQHSPTAKSLSDHNNIRNAPNGIRRAKKSVTHRHSLFQKETRATQQKQVKCKWRRGKHCLCKTLRLEKQSALPWPWGVWTPGLSVTRLRAQTVFATNYCCPDATGS